MFITTASDNHLSEVDGPLPAVLTQLLHHMDHDHVPDLGGGEAAATAVKDINSLWELRARAEEIEFRAAVQYAEAPWSV